MEWTDQAFVLSARPYGEGAALVALLTRDHGRHNGLVKGGFGRRNRGTYQPGNRVAAIWKARLEEQLGSLRCEALGPGPAAFMDDPARLACISASCALAETALPEREAHFVLFEAMEALFASLNGENWASVYVHWEMTLLRELGFGLDLATCAATGRNDTLAFVSPKSGRAVSLSAGEPYRDRLLPLPSFLVDGGTGTHDAVLAGLHLTGYFLDRHVMAPHQQKLPDARSRFIDRLRG